MKAIIQTRQGSPDNLKLQDVEKPAPQPGEILVKVHASSVTAGDAIMRKLPGAVVPLVNLFLGFKRKRTPGHEFAGVVEAIGEGVTRFKAGDEIFGTTTGLSSGANAEYMVIPENGKLNVITHKPATLGFEDAAAMTIGAMTALYIMKPANIKKGQRVLVYGASGSVGTYAVQLAKYFGAEVTAVCSTRNFEMVKAIGASHVIDYKQDDFTQNGIRYDIIFDAVGKISRSSAKNSLTENGTFLSVKASTSEQLENLDFIAELGGAGHLRAVIDRCYPLEETAEAHRYVDSGRKSGNVVIQVA